MGLPYSAFLEEEALRSAESNERNWNDFTISEIDSDTDADADLAEEEQLDDENEDESSSNSEEIQNEILSEEQHFDESDDIESETDTDTETDEIIPSQNVATAQHIQLEQQPTSEDTFEESVEWGPPTGSEPTGVDEDEPTVESIHASDSENSEYELDNFFRELGLGEPGSGATGGRSVVSSTSDQVSTFTDAATAASTENDSFVPQPCRDHEWMGRSIESLVSGYSNVAPILQRERLKKKRPKRSPRKNSQHEKDHSGYDSTTPTTSPR